MRVLRICQQVYFVRKPVGVKQEESKLIKEPNFYLAAILLICFIIFRINQQKDCS